jgi:hypothetical protein
MGVSSPARLAQVRRRLRVPQPPSDGLELRSLIEERQAQMKTEQCRLPEWAPTSLEWYCVFQQERDPELHGLPGGSTTQAFGPVGSAVTSTARSRRTATGDGSVETDLVDRYTSPRCSAWRRRLRAH